MLTLRLIPNSNRNNAGIHMWKPNCKIITVPTVVTAMSLALQ